MSRGPIFRLPLLLPILVTLAFCGETTRIAEDRTTIFSEELSTQLAKLEPQFFPPSGEYWTPTASQITQVERKASAFLASVRRRGWCTERVELSRYYAQYVGGTENSTPVIYANFVHESIVKHFAWQSEFATGIDGGTAHLYFKYDNDANSVVFLEVNWPSMTPGLKAFNRTWAGRDRHQLHSTLAPNLQNHTSLEFEDRSTEFSAVRLSEVLMGKWTVAHSTEHGLVDIGTLTIDDTQFTYDVRPGVQLPDLSCGFRDQQNGFARFNYRGEDPQFGEMLAGKPDSLFSSLSKSDALVTCQLEGHEKQFIRIDHDRRQLYFHATYSRLELCRIFKAF